jgi:hypothetical protein
MGIPSSPTVTGYRGLHISMTYKTISRMTLTT